MRGVGIIGGSQCGTVRYGAARIESAALSHGRMDQSAVDGACCWMVSAVDMVIEGGPGRLRSSSIAERGISARRENPQCYPPVCGGKVWVMGEPARAGGITDNTATEFISYRNLAGCTAEGEQ